MGRWYDTPLDVSADAFVADVVAGLLSQIIEQRCPRCGRLTGYIPDDWAYYAPACGRTGCILAILRGRLWESTMVYEFSRYHPGYIGRLKRD